MPPRKLDQNQSIRIVFSSARKHSIAADLRMLLKRNASGMSRNQLRTKNRWFSYWESEVAIAGQMYTSGRLYQSKTLLRRPIELSASVVQQIRNDWSSKREPIS